MTTDKSVTERRVLPYVSAGTFLTTLDHIKSIGGAPNTLDRNALPPSFSGSSKYDTLHALRFFKLIDKDGRPDSSALDRLVNEATRKDALLQILHREYAELIAKPLSTAGVTEVQKWFSENASPSTAAKAKAFFIALAKQVGIPMHALVSNSARAASGSTRRKRTGSKKKENTKTDSAVAALNPAVAQIVDRTKETRLHPAVQAWIDEIPSRDQEWSESDFTNWLSLLEVTIRRAHKLPRQN